MKKADFKKQFMENCKTADACINEYKRLKETKTDTELLKVIFDNFKWVYVKIPGIINDLDATFDKKTLFNAGIIIHDIEELTTGNFVIAGKTKVYSITGNARVDLITGDARVDLITED